MKYTPGPWVVVETPESSHQDFVVKAGRSSVASVYYCSSEAANANLIAAAPDLLEACRAVCDAFAFARHGLEAKLNDAYNDCRAAITKAEA